MNGCESDQAFLEMAIQTVLFRYRDRLQDLTSECTEEESELVKQMAEEISKKTATFRTLAYDVLLELDEQ